MIARAGSRSQPRGQVLVIASVAMVLLVSLLGFAIDGGRGYWERRQVQNAAEHAALAAAWEFCHPAVPGSPDPAGKAVDAASDNGFTHDGVTVWVTPVSPSTGVWEVTVKSLLPTTFTSIMGFQSIAAAGRAVADCRSTSGEGFALFAKGENCKALGKFQIEFSGGENEISGAIHSNGNIRFNGSDNIVNGSVTYVQTPFVNSGSDNDFTPPHAPAGWQDWPVTFNLADYRAMAEANPSDNLHFRTSVIDWSYIMSRPAALRDGLYYSTEKIDVSGSGPITLNVTLVSEKEVIISGSNITMNPYLHNLLAFSGINQPMNDRCDKEGVKMSGGPNTWRGFIYTPESAIIMDGSSNSTLIGSLIGWAIKVSGSTLNNTADPAFFAGPPVLRLVE